MSSIMNEPRDDFSGASFSYRARMEPFHPFTRDLFANGSKRDRLCKWTHLGTASGSIWNGSSRSRVNAKPKRTHLGTVPNGTDPV